MTAPIIYYFFVQLTPNLTFTHIFVCLSETGDLSQPLNCDEPFLLLLSLYGNLIRLHVFSFSLYLSTLVARGETTFPIIPSLPFATGDSVLSAPASDPDLQLNLRIPLPLINSSPQKKSVLSLPIKPEQTLSPSLPEQFSAQDNILSLSSLEPFGSFTQEEEEEEDDEVNSGVHVASIKVEENSALLMERQQKLQKLMESSPLAFPLEFPSSQPSPQSPIKADVFNFSPPILEASSVDDTRPGTPTIDKHNSRHLIFAAYFPLDPSEITQQELNERSAVLCGTGKARKKVDQVVGDIRNEVEHHYRLLEQVHSPVLPDQLMGVVQKFRMLPTFYQNQIASTCAHSLLSSLTPTSPYPSCSQLVFVCQLFSVAGCVQQIIELLVDVIACDGAERRDGAMEKRQPFPHIPNELCFPIVNLLWFYTPSLLLSLHDTAVVFEWLADYTHAME